MTIDVGTELRDIESGSIVKVFAVHEDYVYYDGKELEGITHVDHVTEFFVEVQHETTN